MPRIPPESDIFEFCQDDQAGDYRDFHSYLYLVDDAGVRRVDATRECKWRITGTEFQIAGNQAAIVAATRARHEARFRKEIERDLDAKGKRIVRRADGLHEVDARETGYRRVGLS